MNYRDVNRDAIKLQFESLKNGISEKITQTDTLLFYVQIMNRTLFIVAKWARHVNLSHASKQRVWNSNFEFQNDCRPHVFTLLNSTIIFGKRFCMSLLNCNILRRKKRWNFIECSDSGLFNVKFEITWSEEEELSLIKFVN